MLIKLVVTFLVVSTISFLVLPLEVVSFDGGTSIGDELIANRHYEWFGIIKQADEIIAYPLLYIFNSYNYEPLIRLAVQSIILGLAVTFVLYFLVYRKNHSIKE